MLAFNAAALAAFEAAWLADRVHQAGEVPGTPKTPYATVSLSQGTPTNYRAGSAHRSKSYRIAVQVVGADYAQAAFAAEKADAAFLDKRLIVDGYSCTPCRREIAATIQRDPDGGAVMYGLATYTFSATPTA